MDYNLNLNENKRPNLSAPEFLLDCDYDVDGSENGLVIKWSLNNQLVYQWIPPRAPTALGVFKGRIKKNFNITDDPLKRYRAVAVTRPSLNFSGEYSCSVQTFQSSDKKSSVLQIIGEFHNYQLTCIGNLHSCVRSLCKSTTDLLIHEIARFPSTGSRGSIELLSTE